MMGGHHAVSGAAAWLAITTPVTVGSVNLGLGTFQMDRWETLAGAIVCAGAALLPDADPVSYTHLTLPTILLV